MLNKSVLLIYFLSFFLIKAEEDLVLMPEVKTEQKVEIFLKKPEERFENIYLDDITDEYFFSNIPVLVQNEKKEIYDFTNVAKKEIIDDYNLTIKVDAGFGYNFFQMNNHNNINSFDSKNKIINGNLALELKYKRVAIEYDLFFLKSIGNSNGSLNITSNSTLENFTFFNNHHNLRFKIFFIDNNFLTANLNFGAYIANSSYQLNYSSKVPSSNSSGINKLLSNNENLALKASFIGAQVGTGFLLKFSEYYNTYFDIRYIIPITSLSGMQIHSIKESSFDSFILKIAIENHIILTKSFILNLAVKYHMERFKFINSYHGSDFAINNNLIMFNIGLIFRI